MFSRFHTLHTSHRCESAAVNELKIARCRLFDEKFTFKCALCFQTMLTMCGLAVMLGTTLLWAIALDNSSSMKVSVSVSACSWRYTWSKSCDQIHWFVLQSPNSVVFISNYSFLSISDCDDYNVPCTWTTDVCCDCITDASSTIYLYYTSRVRVFQVELMLFYTLMKMTEFINVCVNFLLFFFVLP